MACVTCPQFLSMWMMDLVLNILGDDFLWNINWKRLSMGNRIDICTTKWHIERSTLTVKDTHGSQTQHSTLMRRSTLQLIHSEHQVVTGPSCAPCQQAHTHSSAWASSFVANWVHLYGTGQYFHFMCCQSAVPTDPILLVEAGTSMSSLWAVSKAFCASHDIPSEDFFLSLGESKKTKPKQTNPSLPRPLSRELYFEHIHVMCEIFTYGWHFMLILSLEPEGCSWWL